MSASPGDDGIVCFDYPFCTRDHAGGAAGCSDGPLVPDEPAAASTGDWRRNAIDHAWDALLGSERTDRATESHWWQSGEKAAQITVDAALPRFVAEATRRIEAERDENATYNYGLDTAAALVRGLADPGTEQQ